MNQRKLEGNNMNTLQERIQDEINELPISRSQALAWECLPSSSA
jgi:hypothetical protein